MAVQWIAILIYAITFSEGFFFEENRLNMQASRITPNAPIGISHKNPILEAVYMKSLRPEGMAPIACGSF